MDINDKIAENTGLVYARLTAFNMLFDQDAESYAYEALYRAVVTFDEKSGVMFSTYAVCCINNALRKHLRTLNKKSQLEVVSYDTPLVSTDEDFCLADIIEHPVGVEQSLLSDEATEYILEVVRSEYELLQPKQKHIIKLFYDKDGKVTQKEIAIAAGVTQATVSKTVSAFRHRVKLRLEEQE